MHFLRKYRRLLRGLFPFLSLASCSHVLDSNLSQVLCEQFSRFIGVVFDRSNLSQHTTGVGDGRFCPYRALVRVRDTNPPPITGCILFATRQLRQIRVENRGTMYTKGRPSEYLLYFRRIAGPWCPGVATNGRRW